MDKRYKIRYGAYIGIMIGLLVGLLLLMLGGCMTTYVVEATHPNGQQTRVEVRSWREFEQPEVHYSRNGDSVTFDFGATSATTATSPIEQAVADKIRTSGLLPGSGNE